MYILYFSNTIYYTYNTIKLEMNKYLNIAKNYKSNCHDYGMLACSCQGLSAYSTCSHVLGPYNTTLYIYSSYSFRTPFML